MSAFGHPSRNGTTVSWRAKWLTVLAVPAVLAVIAVVAGIALLNSTDFKPRLTKAVQDATGRTLVVNGPMRVTLSLWPTVEISDVTLANLLGGSRPDIAHAERIEAQLSLLTLLWHRIEIFHLTLI